MPEQTTQNDSPDRPSSPEIQPKNEQIIVFVDGTDPDNIALAIAARRMFGKNVLVCLSPRPVSNKGGSLDTIGLDDEEKMLSDEMHQLNARRMKKHLIDAGFGDVPVYFGIDIYHAENLTATIPHEKHIDEKDYDFLENDNVKIDGNFDTLKQQLITTNHDVRRVALVGGQFTDIDALMNDGVGFNLLITQGGFNQTTAKHSRFSKKGQLPFNQELDQKAALNVFNNFKGDIIAIASDQTRRDEVSYEDETAMTGWLQSLKKLYRIHRNETITKPNKTDGSRMRPDDKPFFSSPHDVHLSLLNAFWKNREQITARGGTPLYTLKKERDRVEGGHGEYWVVTDLQGPRIKRLFGRILGNPRSRD